MRLSGDNISNRVAIASLRGGEAKGWQPCIIGILYSIIQESPFSGSKLFHQSKAFYRW
jgi:hypothetical protein